MRIDLVSLFPEMCRAVLSAGVVGRAIEAKLVEVVVTDPRQFCEDRHGVVDGPPYGGGPGMILRAPPLVMAVDSVRRGGARVVLMSPTGRTFDQELAQEWTNEDQLILVCGRYKGFDERVGELLNAQELSLGDFVLSGGELAALAVLDAVIRRIPGTLGDMDSADGDSFSRGREGLLDAACYTRPPEYRGLKVPEVLLSGDHAAIERWRKQSSLTRTRARRPDLLDDRKDESG